MAQDEKKSTSEFHSRAKRRPRYFLCGICNIVSIAENSGRQSENDLPNGKGKRFKHKFTRNRDTIESQLDLSSKDETSVESQEVNQTQIPSEGTVLCDGRRMAKICWNADDDVGNVDNIERDSIDSAAEESLSGISQNTAVQGKSVLRNVEVPCQGKVPTNSRQFCQEDWDNETKRRGQQVNSMPKNQKIFPREHALEPFVPTENPTLDKEASSLETIAKDASGCGKKSSSVPEIKINGTVVKPAWVGEESSSTVNRWKRTVALKVNAKRRKRMQRDSVTMNEEYELMIKNLKHYGVL